MKNPTYLAGVLHEPRIPFNMAKTAHLPVKLALLAVSFQSLIQSRIIRLLPLVIFFLLCSVRVFGQTTPVNFTFSLTASAKTSAGVFKTDGTLVRTLWSGVDYAAGTHSKTWDKKDDKGTLLSGTAFTIKVVSNNVSYTWEGVVGNTSKDKTGKYKYRHLRSMTDMALTSTKAYYGTGFVEGNSSAHRFMLNDIQTKVEVTPVQDGDYNLEISYNCTDGTNVYWAGLDPYGTRTFTYATKVSDESEIMMSSGSSASTQLGRTYPKAIDINTGKSSNPSGIAVQKTGNYLFISHKGLNLINIFNKTTGAAVTSFSITAPGDITTDDNNDLWVISGTNTVKRYTVGTNGALTAAYTLTGLTRPISMSTYGSNIAIADEGTSQVKCFNISNGSSVWTLGQQGGYDSDATVANDKFFFWDNNMNEVKGFVSFGTDGSIWVGDAGNNRAIHFSSSRTYIEHIMYMPMNYNAAVNTSDPTRVFCDFLEFKIDYSKPLAGSNGSWTLVKNWKPGLKANYPAYLMGNSDTRETFSTCATFPNGKTYATIRYTNLQTDIRYPEVVELVNGGQLRPTGILLNAFSNAMFDPNGTLRYIEEGKWYEKSLTGYSGNNPVWGNATAIATAGTDSDAPDHNSGSNPVKTSSDMLVVFDRSYTHTGFHLAAIKKGSSSYAWKTSPSTSRTYTGGFPADGTYDLGNGVEYAGGQLYAADKNIFWNYIGEFWKNSQTNKWNHYYDNGLFINQFGITTLEAEQLDGVDAPRMAAGNAFAGGLVKVGSDYYIYHCDESAHGGTHRWKISGLNTISEQVINLNSSYTEINIKGNNVDIAKGANSPNTSDNTDFGSVNSGASVTKTFVIQNTGNLALSVTGITFAGTNASDFTLVSAPSYPMSIAASGSYTITVKFAPSASGARNAIINLANNDPDEGSYDFALKGTGASTSAPEINVTGNGANIIDGDASASTSDNTDFGSVNTGSSANKTFIIQNTGNAALSVTSITFSGTNASYFSLVSAPSFPLSIAASGSYTITVKYAPTASGSSNASINIASDDADEAPYDFALKGIGASTSAPEINVTGNGANIVDGDASASTSDNTDFGSVNTGSSANKTFVIQNTGNAALSVTGISFSGSNASDFTLVSAPSYPMSIAASGSYTITVKYSPSASGSSNAVINIASNDADEAGYDFALKGLGASSGSTAEINVTGNGVNIADGDASASTTDNTDFGPVNGGTFTSKTYVIQNTGNSALSVTGLSVTGANANQFLIVSLPSFPLNLAVSGTYTITVQFSPTAGGTKDAVINIANSDADEGAYDFAIKGLCPSPAPDIRVSGNSVNIADGDVTPSSSDNTDFGSVLSSSSITKTFVIQNSGSTALSVTACTFTGTNASEFSIVSAPSYPLSIAGGNSYTITVKFAPSSAGTRNATMNIMNSDVSKTTFNFDLQGVSASASSPAINIQGNGVTIADGDATPSTSDNTILGSVTSGNSITKTFVIQNTGTSALSVSSCSFTGANASDFSIDYAPSYPLTVAASGSYTITVKFTPSATGTRNATMNVNSSDANKGTYDFALQGTATAGTTSTSKITVKGNGRTIVDGDASPSTTDFTIMGSVATGSSLTKTFVIQNTGTSALSISGIDFSGTNASEFALSGAISYPLSLAVNASKSITVAFAPQAAGTRNATINIYSNDPATATFNFALRGTATTSGSGSSSVVTVTGNNVNIVNGDATPSTTDFTYIGSTEDGSFITKAFVVKNVSSSTIEIENISATGTNSAEFSIHNPPSYPLFLAANATVTIYVKFSPNDPGTYNAVMNVFQDGKRQSIFSYSVQGVGTTKRSLPESGEQTSVQENAKPGQLKLDFIAYPNPFTGSFKLRYDNVNGSQSAKIRIIDIQGRVVFEETQSLMDGNNEIEIGADYLSRGIYYVSLIIDNQVSTPVAVQKIN